MDEVYSWHSTERVPTGKSADWFWTVTLITAVIAIAALIVQNWLFALIVIIGGGLIAHSARRPGNTSVCKITSRGVVANGDLFPYNNLRSFEIDDRAHRPTLVLNTNGLILHRVAVPLDEADIELVRELISQFVAEEAHSLSIAHAIGERLGIS